MITSLLAMTYFTMYVNNAGNIIPVLGSKKSQNTLIGNDYE